MNGSDYTIRQAIRYKKNGQIAVAKFVFHIHVTDARVEYELQQKEEEGTSVVETNSELAYPVEVFSLTGIRVPSLQRGANVVKMSDGSVRKVLMVK